MGLGFRVPSTPKADVSKSFFRLAVQAVERWLKAIQRMVGDLHTA